MTPSEQPVVSYIPSQLHGPSGSDPVMLRQSPLRLLVEEMKLIIGEIKYFPYIFCGGNSGASK